MTPSSPMLMKPNAPGMAVVDSPSNTPSVATELSTVFPADIGRCERTPCDPGQLISVTGAAAANECASPARAAYLYEAIRRPQLCWLRNQSPVLPCREHGVRDVRNRDERWIKPARSRVGDLASYMPYEQLFFAAATPGALPVLRPALLRIRTLGRVRTRPSRFAGNGFWATTLRSARVLCDLIIRQGLF